MTSFSLVDFLLPVLVLPIPAAFVTTTAWWVSARTWSREAARAVAWGSAAGQVGFAVALILLWVIWLPFGDSVGVLIPAVFLSAPVVAAWVAHARGAVHGRAAAVPVLVFLAGTYPLTGYWLSCFTDWSLGVVIGC